MEAQEQQKTPGRAPRFQFSLRALFWLTAGVAVLCSLVFAMPNWAAVPLMVLLTFAFPGVTVVLLAHGGPGHKAFAIGAVFPACVVFLMGAFIFMAAFSGSTSGALLEEDSGRPIRIILVGGLLVTVLCGLLCLAVDRAVRRSGRGKKRF